MIAPTLKSTVICLTTSHKVKDATRIDMEIIRAMCSNVWEEVEPCSLVKCITANRNLENGKKPVVGRCFYGRVYAQVI